MSKKKDEHREAVAAHLIDKYRERVGRRYHYDELSQHFELSDNITRELVDNIHHLFLNYIYPKAEDRKRLEHGFESLAEHLKNPAKSIFLLGDMTAAVLKFGFQFPAAVRAGAISLDSFVEAKKFEQALVDSAMEMNLEIPVSDEDFQECLTAVPKRRAKRFLRDFEGLMKSLTNTSLLRKTVEILKSLEKKMAKHTDTYTDEEIKGVGLGIKILQAGYDVFKDLDFKTKREVIKVIIENEERQITELYPD